MMIPVPMISRASQMLLSKALGQSQTYILSACLLRKLEKTWPWPKHASICSRKSRGAATCMHWQPEVFMILTLSSLVATGDVAIITIGRPTSSENFNTMATPGLQCIQFFGIYLIRTIAHEQRRLRTAKCNNKLAVRMPLVYEVFSGLLFLKDANQSWV